MVDTIDTMNIKPNVILVITDDQGYGDLACTGNPWIKTPNIDDFHDDSARLVDFHVSPLCTPTRGAIMSGRLPVRNGAWATTWGRSMLRREEVTMADCFRSSGYRTGMFGKWHLGDNYPYRPQDRGFEHVVAHKGGGVGQTPDFWGNSYFDDTYFHNGNPVSHDGYCTDIWFDEAMDWISRIESEPFFCYLATNAPHGPYRVDEKYSSLYTSNPDIPHPNFYGMITNIDENFGRLLTFLRRRRLDDNTIVIFMTDNGSSGGCELDERGFVSGGYNAGMRGKKGSYYEGGHRVPFFIRWPVQGIGGGIDIEGLTFHVDLLPTFIDMCDLDISTDTEFDGISISSLLRADDTSLPDRTSFIQYRQNTDPPEKWDNAVVTERWRLIGGNELYDIKANPAQEEDVAAQHPDVVMHLRGEHEKWWTEIAPGFAKYCPISLGNPAENPTRLDAFDLMGDVAWDQTHILAAVRASGAWCVDVERDGTYELRVQRWPDEALAPIRKASADGSGTVIHPRRVRVKIGDIEQARDIEDDAEAVQFHLNLSKGIQALKAWFVDEDGDEYAPYYVYARYLSGHQD